MRIEWECSGEQGVLQCCDGAFFVGLRLSFRKRTVLMNDGFEDFEPEKQASLGFKCDTMEQTLPNGAVLHACILSSDALVLREITRRYAGEVYAEITSGGTRIVVVNDGPQNES